MKFRSLFQLVLSLGFLQISAPALAAEIQGITPPISHRPLKTYRHLQIRHAQVAKDDQQDAETDPLANPLLASFFKNIKFITVGSAADVPEPIEINDQRSFGPASVTKVVTSAVALAQLGPEYRFETDFEWQAHTANPSEVENFVIRGSGDPVLGTETKNDKDVPYENVQKIVRAIKEKGVQVILGDIQMVSIDPRLDMAAHPKGLEPTDYLECYGAVAQAFNFKENCDGLTITGLNQARWSDPDNHFPIEYQMVAGNQASVVVEPHFDENGRIAAFILKGSWAPHAHLMGVGPLPISDAKAWVKQIFISEMRRQGIVIKAGAQPAAPSELEAVSRQSYYSIPLAEILKDMDKVSDNFLADSLFRATASLSSRDRSADMPDLREAGKLNYQSQIQSWMITNGTAGFASELGFVDGSGLSRANRATARSFKALLKQFVLNENFPYLWDALPIAGVDGTLRGRMVGTPAQGKVRAKTGTERGLYQLIGYIPKYEGSEIRSYFPFVILTEAKASMARSELRQKREDKERRQRVHEIQNSIVNRLMQQINP
jgi:D-alanyl-D-alanine carboxypeptidase/D-alanyl-D-alanine-endopeptidase (penicillin-binding protein 4)